MPSRAHGIGNGYGVRRSHGHSDSTRRVRTASLYPTKVEIDAVPTLYNEDGGHRSTRR
jgi:hypothetical protein